MATLAKTPTGPNGMTPAETGRFQILDEQVVAGIEVFVEVGKSLAEIRDRKLYRAEHGTFEAYCDSRGLAQSRAYQLMDAAGVVSNLKSSTIVELPTNEAQARPLSKLPPAEQPVAWKEAIDTAPDGKVTAKHVEQVVRRRRGEDDDEPAESLVDTAPLAALAKAEAEQQPRTWGDRTIPDDAPPLDLDVSDEPSVRWAAMVSYFQRGISRLPDKDTLEGLPEKKSKYIIERFREFAKQIKEAV